LVPGRIEAEDYRPGGEGVGYHDWTKGNFGRVDRNDDVDIERCGGQARCYNVAWVQAGEWLGYDVRFPADGSYTFTVRAAAAARGKRLHLELDGVNVTGPLSVPATGGWHSWTDVIKADVPVKAGDYVMRLVADTDGFNVDAIAVSGGPSTPGPASTQASTP
jgi:hypothetical protein